MVLNKPPEELAEELINNLERAEHVVGQINAELPPHECSECDRPMGNDKEADQSIFDHTLCKRCGILERIDIVRPILEEVTTDDTKTDICDECGQPFGDGHDRDETELYDNKCRECGIESAVTKLYNQTNES